MESKAVLSLLFLAVVASGCSHGGSADEPDRAITVQDLSLSSAEIYEGTSVTVSMEVENTGKLPADIYLGDRGKRVMKDYCPDIFRIPENGFNAVTSGKREGDRIHLEPGRKIRMNWELRQEGDVPLIGHRCDLKFQLPFNYSVNAYRQVQIKQNREIQGSRNLRWESSSGPMRFAIETLPGSTENPATFVTGRDDDITVLFQLQNTGQEGYSKGVIDVAEQSIKVRATEPLELTEGFVKSSISESDLERISRECTEDRRGIVGRNLETRCLNQKIEAGSGKLEWRSFQGYSQGQDPRCDVSSNPIKMFEGESRVLRCSVPLPESIDSPGVISDIFATANYTYLKEVGSRTVRVKTRGN